MATDILVHEPRQDYLGPVQAFEEHVEAPAEQSRVDLMGTLKRRWLLILLVWLIPTIPAVIFIQNTMEITYTATGQIMVEPTQMAPIPNPYVQQQQLQNFDSFLQTQAELLVGSNVLNEAVNTLALQSPDLAIFQSENPVLELSKQASAEIMRGSYLINLSVTQDDPAEAKQLASAILSAYMLLEGDQGETERAQREELLVMMKKDFDQKLEDLNRRITDLSKTHGASSVTQFDVIREARESEASELRKALREAEDQVSRLQRELEILNKTGSGPDPTLPENIFELRSRFVNEDPAVVSVRDNIMQTSAQLRNLLSRLSDEHQEVVRMREHLDRLQNELEEEEKRATADFDKRMKDEREQRIEEQRTLLTTRLETAKVERENLKTKVNELENTILEMGRVGVSIMDLKAQRELVQSKFDEIADAKEDVDLEKWLPSRIKPASQPEIRPGGVNDPRKKLIIMTIGGMFCFAFGVALLREHRDHSLHETDQLKQMDGIAFLGAVPALRDLEQGLVSQEDFAESYRAIRTALSGRSRGRRDKTFLVTSARSGEGKTSLAISLAVSFTEPGHRVLLIDGDTQVPNASRVLKLKPRFGLRDALIGERAARECVVKSKIPHLDVLVCQANGQGLGGLLDSRTAENVLNALGDSYDYIILDSPPALSAADALVWATVVDGVVLSSFIGETDRVAMEMTCERLAAVGARILGSVAANVPRNAKFYSYSTTSYERQQGGQTDAGARQLPFLDSYKENEEDRES